MVISSTTISSSNDVATCSGRQSRQASLPPHCVRTQSSPHRLSIMHRARLSAPAGISTEFNREGRCQAQLPEIMVSQLRVNTSRLFRSLHPAMTGQNESMLLGSSKHFTCSCVSNYCEERHLFRPAEMSP